MKRELQGTLYDLVGGEHRFVCTRPIMQGWRDLRPFVAGFRSYCTCGWQTLQYEQTRLLAERAWVEHVRIVARFRREEAR